MSSISTITNNSSVKHFLSLEQLETRHSELLQRHRYKEDTQELVQDIETFIQDGQAAGTVLYRRDYRWALQDLLDYWSTILYREKLVLPDITLAEFDITQTPELPDELCPYPGLRAFDQAQDDLFFGREHLITQMKELLHSGERLLAVTGERGSGKSSLIHAGLLPDLKQGKGSEAEKIPGSESWRYITITPGVDPHRNLTSALHRHADNPDGPAVAMNESTAPAHGDVAPPANPTMSIIEAADRKTVLVVDQVEEMFTLCDDEAKRQEFIETLREKITDSGYVVILIICSDFMTEFSKLYPISNFARVQVKAMELDELRRAIEEPANRIGLNFDEGIIDRLSAYMQGEPGGLSLLQFMLVQLWQRRTHNWIMKEVYDHDDLKNPRNALISSADSFYKKLDSESEQQETVKKIFLQMVRPSGVVGFTCERIPLDKICRSTSTPGQAEEMIYRLVCEARLVRLSGTTTNICAADFEFETGKLLDFCSTECKRGNVLQIELVHEALLMDWPPLERWLEADGDRIRHEWNLRWNLGIEAREWEKHSAQLPDRRPFWTWLTFGRWKDWQGKHNRLLWGSRLEQMQKLAAEPKDLNDLEQRFINASQAAQKFRTVLRVAVAIVLVSLLVGLVLMYLYFEHQQNQRNLVGKLAAEAELEVEKNPELGLRLAVTAFDQAGEDNLWRVDNALRRTLALAPLQILDAKKLVTEGDQSSLASISFDPAGAKLATIGAGGKEITVWDVARNRKVTTCPDHAGVRKILFNAAGTRLAALRTDEKEIRVWDTANCQNLAILPGVANVKDFAFSPDGTRLATASFDGKAHLWDIATGQEIVTLPHETSINLIAFNSDGTRLATASFDGKAHLWDIAGRKEFATLPHKTSISLITFSQKGEKGEELLATADIDGKAHLWDIANRLEIATLPHKTNVTGLAFSPESGYLATVSVDSTAHLWNIASGQEISAFPHEATITQLSFNPAGTRLITASSNGKIYQWGILGSPEPDIVYRAANEFTVISPNNNLLASVTKDRATEVHLADLASDQTVGLLPHEAGIASITFSPDGNYLVTTSMDGKAYLWDSRSRKKMADLAHTSGVKKVVFSLDGTQLATISADGREIGVWNVAALQKPVVLTHPDEVVEATFNPQTDHLTTVTLARKTYNWDIATGQKIEALPVMTDVKRIDLSPNGAWLTTVNSDGTKVRVWDISNSRELAVLSHQASVRDIIFSPNDTWLATISANHEANGANDVEYKTIVWDVTTGQELRNFSNQTDVRQAAFSPDGSSLAVASAGDNTVRVWNIASPQEPIILTQNAAVDAITFSQDGRFLFTVSSDDGLVRRWRLVTEEMVGVACGIGLRPLTPSEQEIYLGQNTISSLNWLSFFGQDKSNDPCR